MGMILIAPKWRERTLNSETFEVFFHLTLANPGIFQLRLSSDRELRRFRNSSLTSMCSKSSIDSIKHFRTVASYFSASLRWWAPSAANDSVSLFQKKEHQDTALHMIERVKCLRALCRNHQRRKHSFFRRKSRGAQRGKIKSGKLDTHIHISRRWKEITMPQNGKYIFCRTYCTVRSGYIIQAIRDGNADIVTSISLKKETPAALRESKKREE